MNKKLHLFLFCLAVFLIFYLCKDNIINLINNLIEPFTDQIIIQPDNKTLNPKETTFSILTYDSNIETGITQASICNDDPKWTKDNKTCRDYSLNNSNCNDIGDNGVSALEACRVACDNCDTYKEIKRRLPSPTQEIDEPPYSQFEESDDITGIGSEDYRELYSKLDEMSEKIQNIETTVGTSISQMGVELSNLAGSKDLTDDSKLSADETVATSGKATIELIKKVLKKRLSIIYQRIIQIFEYFEKNKNKLNETERIAGIPTDKNYLSNKENIKKSKEEIDKLDQNSEFKDFIKYIIEIILYYRFLELKKNTEKEVNYKSKIQDVEVDITNLLKTIKDDLESYLSDKNIGFDNNDKINEIERNYDGRATDEERSSYLTGIFNSLVSFSTSIVSLEIALATDYGIAEARTGNLSSTSGPKDSSSSGDGDENNSNNSNSDNNKKDDKPIVSTQTLEYVVGGVAVAGGIGLLADRLGLFNE